MKLNTQRTRRLILPALLLAAALLGNLIVPASQAASNNAVAMTAAPADCAGSIIPAALPQPYVAVPYARILLVNQPGNYTFSVLTGALPPGLNLVSAFGVTSIAGLPTTPGTYSFTIKARKNGATCEITRSYSVTIPATVVPILECAQRNQDGSWMARFGYNNSTGAAAAIPVGRNNYFTPGAQDRGQTTVFQPGRVINAFSVTFAQSQGNNLAAWFLRGPDNVLRPVNALTATVGCPSNTAPVVSIATPSAGATFQQGDTIAFTATATDAEDGNLDAQIVWTAAVANNPSAITPLGTGASVSYNSLAPGAYLITARVTDSGGLAGVAQVGITVNTVTPCQVFADFLPETGDRAPGNWLIDARPQPDRNFAGSYDTCGRPLKLFWHCNSVNNPQACSDFMSLANANDNTTWSAILTIREFDDFAITLNVCVAGTNECAPTVSKGYTGLSTSFNGLSGLSNSGSFYRNGRLGEVAPKNDTMRMANFQFK
jgi:hypothetical protein